ncbi:hypothetical protein [Alkalicoccus chagannorensis]|uniref:hypothetical protein n=1 Tax=Alkalicoccus chagannorensis TaxID=427072 RepID=UPI00041CDD35|nr:hypothetical protein [Alkalicoccus chagannorensis]
MRPLLLAGVIIGFLLVFFFRSLWTGETDWGWLLSMSLGAVVAFVTLFLLFRTGGDR